MINFKINYPQTYLPLKMARGTAKERLDRARHLNDQFFQRLRLGFKNEEISPGIFCKMLQKTADAPINVEVLNKEGLGQIGAIHFFDEKAVNRGYSIFLPLTIKNKISKINVFSFMAGSMQFFNEILNPKFFKRKLATYAKYQPTNSLKEFYDKTVRSTKQLTERDLAKILKGKPIGEQIDYLQILRYDLISDTNIALYLKQLKRNLPKDFKNNNRPHSNLDKYKLDEKLKLIETVLADTLKKARAKN